MNIQNESIKHDALATAIGELVEYLKQPKVSAEDELWTSTDVACYLKLSLDTIERYVISRPDFPQSLQPCLTGKRAAKRWFAGEVIRWAKQNKGNLPTPRKRNRQPRREATSDAVAL